MTISNFWRMHRLPSCAMAISREDHLYPLKPTAGLTMKHDSKLLGVDPGVIGRDIVYIRLSSVDSKLVRRGEDDNKR